MRPLPALERFFEQLFERPATRLFRPRLQPVQLQRRIERAMETDRMSGGQRVLVPNRFRVHLFPDDLQAFGELTSTLATDLAEGALAFARSHHYSLVDRPRVDLVADPAVARGEIRVEARFAERQPTTPQPGPVASVDAPPGDGAESANGPADPADAPASQTMVFRIPKVEGPLGRLRELRPNGTQREIVLDGAPLTIGRAGDNGLVINDARVSRHHGRLQARRGALIFTDLASTNGSRVNGARVAEVALGEGDRIEIGDTVLVVEAVSGR